MPNQPIYRLHVQRHLAPNWTVRFDGLLVATDADGKAALYSLISRVRNLGEPCWKYAGSIRQPPA